MVDLLQSIVEIVTYGDRQDPMIFEYELLPLVLFFHGFWVFGWCLIFMLQLYAQMFYGKSGFSRICTFA